MKLSMRKTPSCIPAERPGKAGGESTTVAAAGRRPRERELSASPSVTSSVLTSSRSSASSPHWRARNASRSGRGWRRVASNSAKICSQRSGVMRLSRTVHYTAAIAALERQEDGGGAVFRVGNGRCVGRRRRTTYYGPDEPCRPDHDAVAGFVVEARRVNPDRLPHLSPAGNGEDRRHDLRLLRRGDGADQAVRSADRRLRSRCGARRRASVQVHH